MPSTGDDSELILQQQNSSPVKPSPPITPRQSWTKSAELLSNFVNHQPDIAAKLPSVSPPPIPLPRTKFLSLPSDEVLTDQVDNNQKEFRRSTSVPSTSDRPSLDIKTQHQRPIPSVLSTNPLPVVEEINDQQNDSIDEVDEEDEDSETWL